MYVSSINAGEREPQTIIPYKTLEGLRVDGLEYGDGKNLILLRTAIFFILKDFRRLSLCS